MDAMNVLLRLLVADLLLPESIQIELITHENKLNWRQLYPTTQDRVRNLRAGLIHDGPFHGRLVRIGDLEEQVRLMSTQIDPSNVISATSRLFDSNGDFLGHIAFMNLHPEGLNSIDLIAHVITEITNGLPGYLLSSGRYYHYYGKRILRGEEWTGFLAQFLMPCMMVSPRYVGHSLFQGFCAVRLTAAAPYKSTVPWLLAVL